MKKITTIVIVFIIAPVLSGCQANYIRDVQGGTVAPSSTSTLTGIEDH
ncbi:TPA: lysis protein [Salmonella enterica]|uniref:Lysis protein for colicin n=1 Tax=Salmonella enterica TaxID=28901 RepID=A0A744QJD5_SALER|nr:lysis protein [Salmonella enterica]